MQISVANIWWSCAASSVGLFSIVQIRLPAVLVAIAADFEFGCLPLVGMDFKE